MVLKGFTAIVSQRWSFSIRDGNDIVFDGDIDGFAEERLHAFREDHELPGKRDHQFGLA